MMEFVSLVSAFGLGWVVACGWIRRGGAIRLDEGWEEGRPCFDVCVSMYLCMIQTRQAMRPQLMELTLEKKEGDEQVILQRLKVS